MLNELLSAVRKDVPGSVLALCALGITALVGRRLWREQSAQAQTTVVTSIDHWTTLAQEGHRFGARGTPVTIVEFADFQCPFCAQAVAGLDSMMRHHEGQVAIVFRQFPLYRIHPHAVMAAEVSECAAAQHRFEAFYHILYANQDSLGLAQWTWFAESAKVPDLDRFRACVAQHQLDSLVRRDMRVGDSIGVTATPTFVVNGRMFAGNPPGDSWDDFVSEILASSQSDK